MAATIERPAGYEDLLKVPENRIAEIIDGRLAVTFPLSSLWGG